MGRFLGFVIKTNRHEVNVYFDDDNENQSCVTVLGNDVVAKPGLFDLKLFESNLNDSLLLVEKVFPEVPFDEAIVDYGLASIELIQRVNRLQEGGIPATIVDVFEHETPCAIAAHSVVRLLKG